MTVSEEPLGLAEPVQLVAPEWITGCFVGLAEAGYSYLTSDTALPPQRWSAYRVLVLSSYEYLAGHVQRAVLEFARAGGVVVLGPRLPHLDERMHPDETLVRSLADQDAAGGYRVGQGRIVQITDLTEPRQVFETVLAGIDLLRPEKNDPRVEVTVHAAPGDPRPEACLRGQPDRRGDREQREAARTAGEGRRHLDRRGGRRRRRHARADPAAVHHRGL